jgi:CubicO group peptidase (beta-lactamase class C family)
MTVTRIGKLLLTLVGCIAIVTPGRAQRAAAPGADEPNERADEAPNIDLASYVDQARQEFNVPGIALAVVKDGTVVFEQGFGKRNLNDGKLVDAHTMFCIASNTKSFTATAVEMLADHGKLHLDDRVIEHLPWFRMADPYVTREIRVRDLLAHRSGLGSHAGDLLFLPATTYSTREVVERLRNLPIKTGFRDSFAYENIMFAVATLVIEQASGQTYAEFVSEHIFRPIGMTESRIDSTYLRPGDDVATAYMLQDNGQLTATPALAWKNSPGAAGIYASVHDMAKWVQVQLAGGKLPDNRNTSAGLLISETAQQRMWSMITPIDIDPAPVPQLQAAQPNFLGYAEGWYLSDYRGQRLVWHDGGFPGTVSLVTLLPALRIGVVVLTNQESEDALHAITSRVLDGYLGAPRTNWIEAYAASTKLAANQVLEQRTKQAADYVPDAKPSRPLASYAHTYHDRWYGDIDIRLVDGELRLRFTKSPRLVGWLSAWRDDTFLVRWDDRTLNADALIDFALDQNGNVREAHMRRASPRTAHAYDYQDLDLVPKAYARTN